MNSFFWVSNFHDVQVILVSPKNVGESDKMLYFSWIFLDYLSWSKLHRTCAFHPTLVQVEVSYSVRDVFIGTSCSNTFVAPFSVSFCSRYRGFPLHGYRVNACFRSLRNRSYHWSETTKVSKRGLFDRCVVYTTNSAKHRGLASLLDRYGGFVRIFTTYRYRFRRRTFWFDCGIGKWEYSGGSCVFVIFFFLCFIRAC